MRLLILLDGADYAAPPFLALATYLRPAMEIILASANAERLAEYAAQGWPTHLIEATDASQSHPIGRSPLLQLWPDARHSYRQHRALAQQARHLLQQTQPDVIVMAGDFDGLTYHLAQQPAVPSIVLQITMLHHDADLLIGRFANPSRAHQVAIQVLRGLSALTGRSWLYRYPNGRYSLPHGLAVGKTLGAVLAGKRYQMPVKGFFCSALCVNGPSDAAVFADLGVPPEKIHLTGSPNADLFHQTRQAHQPSASAALKTQLGLPPQAKLISFFLQPFSDSMLGGQGYASEIKQLAAQLSELAEDVHLVLKLHPRHPLSRYQPDPHPRIHWLEHAHYPGEDFNNALILASQFTITRSSTIGYNALALNVPLLSYAFYDLPIEKMLQPMTPLAHATSPHAFLALAQRLWHDPDFGQAVLSAQQTIRDQYMLLDGQCMERIKGVLLGLG
jgi:UDP-N-acetylglucosamine 2-epimerase